MNANDFVPWLQSGVGEVLECMCFLTIASDAPGGTTTEEDPAWLSCSLEFAGGPSGYFGVRAPWPTARLIAANFLGEEEQDIDETQTIEVFCEVANMGCGAVLAHLDRNRTFSLSSPARDLRLRNTNLTTDRIGRLFTLDEGLLHAWFEIGAAA